MTSRRRVNRPGFYGVSRADAIGPCFAAALAPAPRLRHSPPMSDSMTSGANAPEFSVSELSGALKRAIEDQFGYVRVRGEISGYRGPHSSGHVYFSLKDAAADSTR